MIKHFLTFEKNIADLEGKIEDLKHISSNSDFNIAEEIGKLQNKVADELTDTYSNLNPWQKVQVARHPDRPQFQDVIKHLIDGYLSLGGDRLFGNDNALTGGLGYFRGKKVLLLGIDKGKNTNDRIIRNFGMARPEGYRKAIRLMELANRFSLPVLSFIDTAGAYPGKGAEERGQAQAIASCVDACLKLNTPMISTILGEGGAEQLLGQGDMLYMAGGGRIGRVHGPFVSDEAVERVVNYLRDQAEPEYIEEVTESEHENPFIPSDDTSGRNNSGDDEMYDRAVAVVCRERKASTSFVQRHLQIGYNRAARIIERMEAEAVISKANHAGKREVLARNIDDQGL